MPGAEDTDANPSIEESETYYAERRDGGDSDPENKADVENPALVDKDEAGKEAPGSELVIVRTADADRKTGSESVLIQAKARNPAYGRK